MILAMHFMGHVQGIPAQAISGTGIDIGTLFQEKFHDIIVTSSYALVKRGPSIGILDINHVGLVLYLPCQFFQFAILGKQVRIRLFGSRTRFRCNLGTTRMISSPIGHLWRVRNNIGWQIFCFMTTLGDCSMLHLAIVSECMSIGFEMYKQIGHIVPIEWKWTSMQNRVALIQYHIPRFHGDIMSTSVMSNDFEWPRFVQFRIDIDDCRRYQWKSIDVGAQHGPSCVDTNPIQGALGQFLVRPFLNRRLGRVPKLLFQTKSTTSQSRVFDIDNSCFGMPMIGIRIALWPSFP
mmetsp:Transcript_6405/g.14509  ORF Transcript_6405/g.14509 Transcript_6405/m.14509 type:complete len:292 (-) Transcript_6405:476-1351(-)